MKRNRDTIIRRFLIRQTGIILFAGLVAIMFVLCFQRMASAGNERILIGEYHGAKVIEIDREGTVYFEYHDRHGVQDVDYLPNGNILVTGTNWNTFELDRSGNIVKEWSGTETANSAHLLEDGNLVVGEWYYKRGREINTSGITVWEYIRTGNITDVGSVQRLSNGNTLISFGENSGYALDSIVVEVNLDGDVVWEYDAGYFFLPREAERLSSGNTLITDASDVSGYERGILEVDSAGNIVWQFNTGLHLPMAAHRLPNGNTLIADTYNGRVIEVDTNKNIVWEYSTGYNTTPWDVEYRDGNDCEGDFDGDGDVDGSDLALFAADFGRTDCSTGDACEGDFDGDGDVDGSDLAVFASDFGRTDCL
jgi:hypothetical protein